MISRGKRKYLEREYRALKMARYFRAVAPHLTPEKIAKAVEWQRKAWDRKGGERYLGYTTASKADKKEFAAFDSYMKQLGDITLDVVPTRRIKVRGITEWTPLEREEFSQACKLAGTIGLACALNSLVTGGTSHG